MQRTFIALHIDPGEIMLACLRHLREELIREKIKWVDQGNLHITLRFLGDTDPQRVLSTGEILGRTVPGFPQPEVVFRGLGLFRSVKDPRVLWIGMDPGKTLTELKGVVDRELAGIGFEPEERSFRPHLTLARIKYIGDREKLGELLRAYRYTIHQTSLLTEVIYYESILSSGGPRYIPLRTIPFKT